MVSALEHETPRKSFPKRKRHHSPLNGARLPLISEQPKQVTRKHAFELQKLVFKSAKKKGVKPAELAQLVGAWDKLVERQRIIKGEPLPGSLKPSEPIERSKQDLSAATVHAAHVVPIDVLKQSSVPSQGNEPVTEPEQISKPGDAESQS